MSPEAKPVGPSPGAEENGELDWRAQARPVSVNWHVWPRCNYRCSFCFATFREVPRAMPKAQALLLPGLLRQAGTKKLTFAGGEPTLCPYLPELLDGAKGSGLVTAIVTNGSHLTESYVRRIAPFTDWIALSIDSASDSVEAELGRGFGGHVGQARQAAGWIKQAGIHLKVNVTVVAANAEDDLHPLLEELAPERLKFFQGLPVHGENDGLGSAGWATRTQFAAFVARHEDLSPVAETNSAMTNSYVMLDPLGRFFQNVDGRYLRSDPVVEAGVLAGLNQVGWDPVKFEARGGLYAWG